jgi:hypothetical protein
MKRFYSFFQRFSLLFRDNFPLLFLGASALLFFITILGIYFALGNQTDYSFPDFCYKGFQVLLFESGENIDAPAGWSLLGVSRVLAPLLLVVFSISGIYFIFTAAVKSYFLRFRKGHTILLGLGANGREYLISRDSGERCIVVLGSPTPEDKQFLKERHFSLFQGSLSSLQGNDADFLDSVLCNRIGLAKASLVLALGEDDGTNIKNATRVSMLLPELRAYKENSVPKICCGIGDLGIYSQLMENGLLREQQIEPVNLDVLCAHDAMKNIQPLKGLLQSFGGTQFKPVHLVVLGFGALGRALVKVAAEVGAYSDTERMKILVIDANAEALLENFLGEFPGIAKVADIQACSADIQSRKSGEAIQSVIECDSVRPVLVMTVHDTTQATSLVLNLAAKPLGDQTQIYVRDTSSCCNAGWLLEKHLEKHTATKNNENNEKIKAFWAYMGKVQLFGNAQSLYSRENLIGEAKEKDAMQFHHNYSIKAQEMFGDSIIDWKDLDAFRRYSNYCAAQHMEHKIHALGFLETKGHEEEIVQAINDHFDGLCRLEHARWNAERYTNGWTFSETKNIAKKENPNLVSWEKLSEAIQKYDAVSIETMKKLKSKSR